MAMVVAVSLLVFPTVVRAHCPLCTAGAGGAAALAGTLGIGPEIVGVFVGAFGIATGLWMGNIIKQEYLPYQNSLILIGVFLSIVIPLVPLFTEYSAITVGLAGGYGTPLNRTYLINQFLVGSVLGGLTTLTTPRLSHWISCRRQATIPYQGIALTFVSLGVVAMILGGLL